MAISTRLRFEIFKRDSFTCRYCGRKSPAVVLEIDHVLAQAKGGNDDPMNLVTSCYDCNAGKSDRNLSEIVTGEDPHDRAIQILERERQMSEYDHVQRQVAERIAKQAEWLRDNTKAGHSWTDALSKALAEFSIYDVKAAVDAAFGWPPNTRWGVNALKYFLAIVRRWREAKSGGLGHAVCCACEKRIHGEITPTAFVFCSHDCIERAFAAAAAARQRKDGGAAP